MFKLRNSLTIGLIAMLCIAAAPQARHYTKQEWKAIKTKLIKMPRPPYPVEARRRFITGSGIYRTFFSERGEANRITILKSTGHQVLDDAVIKTLYLWRAKPGRSWDIDVPVTFTYR